MFLYNIDMVNLLPKDALDSYPISTVSLVLGIFFTHVDLVLACLTYQPSPSIGTVTLRSIYHLTLSTLLRVQPSDAAASLFCFHLPSLKSHA